MEDVEIVFPQDEVQLWIGEGGFIVRILKKRHVVCSARSEHPGEKYLNALA